MPGKSRERMNEKEDVMWMLTRIQDPGDGEGAEDTETGEIFSWNKFICGRLTCQYESDFLPSTENHIQRGPQLSKSVQIRSLGGFDGGFG